MSEQDLINVLFLVYSLVIALMLWRKRIKIQMERKKQEYFEKKMKDLKPLFGGSDRMNIIEYLDFVIRQKDELRQKIAVCSIGIQHQKDDIRENEARLKNKMKIDEGKILKETDWKELKITNKDGRDAYVLEQQQTWVNEYQTTINEDKMILEKSENKLNELKNELYYYKDVYEFFMRIFDIEGNIELNEELTEPREELDGQW